MVTVTLAIAIKKQLKNADGETRTRKAEATRPSSVRVYQFRHIRMYLRTATFQH